MSPRKAASDAGTRRSAPRKVSGQRKRRRSRRKSARRRRTTWWLAGAALAGALLVWSAFVISSAGQRAARLLEDDPHKAPVEVLAAPTVLRARDRLDLAELERSMTVLGYRRVEDAAQDPGEYAISNRSIEIHRRPHLGPHGPVPAAFVRVRLRRGRIVALSDAADRRIPVFTCEPELLGAFHGPELEDRRPLPLAEFPDRLVDAVLSAEDARFRNHSGLDLRAILRAAWVDVTGTGRIQGGSTITQQVIKNLLLGHQRTIFRKAREAILALYVERRLPKTRILEIYLNEIYLGQRGPVSVIGMPAASLHYFGKDISDLDLAEAALLAGMIASPGRYDPRRHPERAASRRGWVLERMERLGAIDAAEREAAAASAVTTSSFADESKAGGSLLDAVRRELEERGFEPRPEPRTVRVFTAVDPTIQRAAVAALRETLDELERQRPARAPLEGAVVVLRPASGEIAALVGGRHGTRGGFHRALDARRQPGSAFKPFVALAAFASSGWTPSRLIDDVPLVVETGEGPWSPQNIDGEFRGPVSLREALEKSLNVPFARLGLEIGPETIVRWSEKAGLTGRMPRTPSVALGTGELTPLELASAYGSIATLGTYRSSFIVRGVRRSGQDEAQPIRSTPPAREVLPEADAFMVLDMMAGVTERGTGRGLLSALEGARVAVKTGTSQDGRDAWFVMISGDAVAVAWVGRDDSKPARLAGSSAALPVVRRLVARAGDRMLGTLPRPPADVILARIDPETGGIASYRCPAAIDELFRKGDLPERCPMHLSFWRRLGRQPGRTEPGSRR